MFFLLWHQPLQLGCQRNVFRFPPDSAGRLPLLHALGRLEQMRQPARFVVPYDICNTILHCQ